MTLAWSLSNVLPRGHVTANVREQGQLPHGQNYGRPKSTE